MRARIPQSAVVRLVVSMIAGTAVGTAVGIMLTDAELGVLAGVAATGAIFSAAGWILLSPMDADQTHDNAYRETLDQLGGTRDRRGRPWRLVSIVVLLVSNHAHADPAATATALAAIFMAWAGLHLMYAARYAYLSPSAGGSTSTIPITGRRSATSFTSVQPRHDLSGFRHERLEPGDSRCRVYAFGTIILATAINLVVGFGHWLNCLAVRSEKQCPAITFGTRGPN